MLIASKGLIRRSSPGCARPRENICSRAAAASDGESGGYQIKDLDGQIANALGGQARGYVTDPIRRPNGFLILRVDQKHSAGLAPFEEVEGEVGQKLFMPRFEPTLRTYLTELRQQAFLQIREGYVDSGAAPGKDTRWLDPAQLKPETVTKEEVASQIRSKRLLWMLPIPWAKTSVTTTSRSR